MIASPLHKMILAPNTGCSALGKCMYPGGDTNTYLIFCFSFSWWCWTWSPPMPHIRWSRILLWTERVAYRNISRFLAGRGGRSRSSTPRLGTDFLFLPPLAWIFYQSVTSAISPSKVHGIFINLTSIRVLLALYEDLIVESTKSAILVFCSKSFPIGSTVIGFLA